MNTSVIVMYIEGLYTEKQKIFMQFEVNVNF